jgi:hypothetical protein
VWLGRQQQGVQGQDGKHQQEVQGPDEDGQHDCQHAGGVVFCEADQAELHLGRFGEEGRRRHGRGGAGLLPEVFGEGKYGTSGVNSRGGKQKYKGEECVWKRVSKDGKHYRIIQHSTGYFYQKGFLPSDTEEQDEEQENEEDKDSADEGAGDEVEEKGEEEASEPPSKKPRKGGKDAQAPAKVPKAAKDAPKPSPKRVSKRSNK